MANRKIIFKSIENPYKWDELVNNLGGNPLQLSGWGNVKNQAGWEVVRIGVYLDSVKTDSPLALAQVLFRPLPGKLSYFAYLSRGPIVDFQQLTQIQLEYSDLCQKLAEFIKTKKRVIAVSFEADELAGRVSFSSVFRYNENYIFPNKTVIMDLTQTEDQIMAGMKKHFRYYTRKSLKNPDLVVRKLQSTNELEQCIKLLHETSTRANFALHTDEYYRQIWNLMGSNSTIWIALYQHNVIGFIWAIHSQDKAYDIYGGSNTDARDLYANYAIKWHAIKDLKALGIKYYDLGGLVSDGVDHFKVGFKKDSDELIGTWDYPGFGYSLWRYGVPLLRKLKQRLHRS